MKHDQKCPRCAAKTFFVIETVTSPNYEYANSFKPLGLTGAYMTGEAKGFFGSAKSEREVVEIEAWVCKECGFTDFYAKDLGLLAKLAASNLGVRVVKG